MNSRSKDITISVFYNNLPLKLLSVQWIVYQNLFYCFSKQWFFSAGEKGWA